ncbi:AsnC family transcriptional regulator [Williamsia phyllosphaerae]|uniref:AsnC family transcriptional regulator n=1 Tax=Williamsia phyllosphaerae TaxID=885042 RepID=A0ABQ1UXT9_9NOCA|nr:AsnC family transcriptional regulator [Williamsia phyllosphaerae]
MCQSIHRRVGWDLLRKGKTVVQAYILIQTEVGRAAQAAAAIAEIPGVASSEEVSGPYDVIVRVSVDDAHHLTATVVPRIQEVVGITRTLTCPVVTDVRAV